MNYVRVLPLTCAQEKKQVSEVYEMPASRPPVEMADSRVRSRLPLGHGSMELTWIEAEYY